MMMLSYGGGDDDGNDFDNDDITWTIFMFFSCSSLHTSQSSCSQDGMSLMFDV